MNKTYDETIMRMCREIEKDVCSQKIIEKFINEGYLQYPTKLGVGRTLSNMEKKGLLINKRLIRLKMSYHNGATIYVYDVKP
jgi:hypothetical protein